MDTDRMTPEQLIRRFRRARMALASLWEGLTEEQMTRRPGPQKDWSVKDVIAHIAWWEDYTLKEAAGLVGGAASEPSEADDILNARSFEKNRDRPLAEILADFQSLQPKIEAFISGLTEEQLNTPGYFKTYDGVALLPILRSGTFGHYPAHQDDLRMYVERIKK